MPDKVTRLETVSPCIERGRVYLPQDAHWLGPFMEEVLAFPNARHDDQVDSMSQFLRWALDREQYRRPEVTIRFPLQGQSGVRDRYAQRTGLPTFPR